MIMGLAPVVVESPFAGDVEKNLRYLRACLADCLKRGEAPFASHGLYTQPGVLRDEEPAERLKGIMAGLSIAKALGAPSVVYTDLGISKGMQVGIEHARETERLVVYRTLGGEWADGA
jgi:hypothetical protein